MVDATQMENLNLVDEIESSDTESFEDALEQLAEEAKGINHEGKPTFTTVEDKTDTNNFSHQPTRLSQVEDSCVSSPFDNPENSSNFDFLKDRVSMSRPNPVPQQDEKPHIEEEENSASEGDDLENDTGCDSDESSHNESASHEKMDRRTKDPDYIDDELLKSQDAELSEEEREKRQEEAQSLKAEGNRQFQEADYPGALESYTNALRTCPYSCVKDRAIMFSNRAACKLRMERLEPAIEDSTKAIELHPVYVKALLRRAELYEKTEKLDEALVDYQKLVELDPGLHKAQEACMRLPDQINERNEKLKTEMMGKLKDLGNMVLKPFGLSTENFKLNQDPNTGSYSVNFQQ